MCVLRGTGCSSHSRTNLTRRGSHRPCGAGNLDGEGAPRPARYSACVARDALLETGAAHGGTTRHHSVAEGFLSAKVFVPTYFVGLICFTASIRFGVVLIAFFLSSSRITKVGNKRKKQIEDGHQEGKLFYLNIN